MSALRCWPSWADRLGLTGELGRRANRGVRAGSHDRGAVLRDLVVMLADGGDCVSDLRTLRQQPKLFGELRQVTWQRTGTLATRCLLLRFPLHQVWATVGSRWRLTLDHPRVLPEPL